MQAQGVTEHGKQRWGHALEMSAARQCASPTRHCMVPTDDKEESMHSMPSEADKDSGGAAVCNRCCRLGRCGQRGQAAPESSRVVAEFLPVNQGQLFEDRWVQEGRALLAIVEPAICLVEDQWGQY